MPALLTRMSTRPKSSSTDWTIGSASSLLGDVGLESLRADAELAGQAADILGGIGRAVVVDGDIGAGRARASAAAAADPPGAAGDQSRLAVQHPRFSISGCEPVLLWSVSTCDMSNLLKRDDAP